MLINKRKGGTEVIVYRDIDTTCGQSGAPVFKKDVDGEWEIIAIHVGFFKKKKANLATLITCNIRNWIVGCIEGKIPIDQEFDPALKQVKHPKLLKRGSSEEIKRLMLKIYDGGSTIDDTFSLVIDGKIDSHKVFVRECQNMKFPNYNKLTINNLQAFASKEEQESLNEFLLTATPETLKNFLIESSDHVDIEPIIEGLGSVLLATKNEIYFDCIKINEAALSTIFSKACKVKRLVLCWCFIDISAVFKIDWEVDYLIEELDLYASCSEFNAHVLDEKKLPIFARALSRSCIG
jgi:hypothetical protein